MLHLHPSPHPSHLVATLGGLLATPPPDPFARELIAVPTRGVERWLTQSLSHDLGVVANVDFPSPRRIAEAAVATACDVEPDDDPWAGERPLWPLLELVDAHLGEPWLHTLADHLRDSTGTGTDTDDRPRRLVATRHLARLYDRYALHRPHMLRAWLAGEDADGSGRPLPPEVAWKAELYRRLRTRIDVPCPAERVVTATARLTDEPQLLDDHLPPRLGVFGLTRLPPAHLAVFRAIAQHRDVHLFLLHPSPALWDRVAASGTTLPPDGLRREDDPTRDAAHHRLLGSWGRDARELQLVLGGETASTAPREPETGTTRTLLRRLQADIRADRPPTSDDKRALDPDDRSVEVHSCHGRARQVEVLRDTILHALREDPSLEPRDVIVMCPDIESFAPLVQATFGTGDLIEDEDLDLDPADTAPAPTGGHVDLRVRLADRALRQTNAVLGAIDRLLELADSRLTASQVLDLADRAPFRRRFGLDDDDLSRIEEWIRDSGIRWGLDAPHRAPFKLSKLADNTWRSGLDRLLVGVTTSEHDEPRMPTGVLPLDDVESGAIGLAGRLAELLDRLDTTIDRFAQPHTIGDWAAQLQHAADLLTATSPADAWQRDELDRLLADLTGDARHAPGPPLTLPEIRDLLDDRLKGRPTRANFRTGHLTFCTLLPMRSVPHRVVCLLGLDDATFPRKAPRDGDDLIARDPHVGDHDGRSEDRQMLLDALLAAGDKLVITYSGADERTNAPLPPAVPIGELLDTIDETVRHPSQPDEPAREAITTPHPLQPFDPRSFDDGVLGRPGPFSFDAVTLDGARMLLTERDEPGQLLDGPLPPRSDDVIALDGLVAFVQHPARAFLRQRLGMSLGTRDDALSDAIPVDLDPLEQWGLGDRILHARLAGQPRDLVLAAERARGDLPPGLLADGTLGTIEPRVDALLAAVESELPGTDAPGSLDAHVRLPDGRTLSGTVPGLRGDCLRLVTYSRVGPKHRLAAWVRLLALTLSHPGRELHAVTIGRARASAPRRATVSVARIGPFGEDGDRRGIEMSHHLQTLVDLYDRGMREPAPLACATSAAYAEAAIRGRSPVQPAGRAWESSWDFEREDKEPEHRATLGRVLTLSELLAPRARADESGEDWPSSEDSRFGRWSVRLWRGLIQHEDVRDR